MKALLVYVDASVVGGCEDPEFTRDSVALWRMFINGAHTLVLSTHTLRELQAAPDEVRRRILAVPPDNQLVLADSPEASWLADEYLRRGVVGPGSRADALHVALATVGRVDVLVSWNFKHIVNLGRIRMFNAVNIEQGYSMLEIRTPKEVVDHD